MTPGHVPAALLAVAAVLLAAACTSKSAGAASGSAACEQALIAGYGSAILTGPSATPGGKPAACAGLDDATLNRLAEQAVKTVLKQVEASPSAFPIPLPTGVPSGFSTDVPTSLAVHSATPASAGG